MTFLLQVACHSPSRPFILINQLHTEIETGARCKHLYTGGPGSPALYTEHESVVTGKQQYRSEALDLKHFAGPAALLKNPLWRKH